MPGLSQQAVVAYPPSRAVTRTTPIPSAGSGTTVPATWYAQLRQLLGPKQVEPRGFATPAYCGEKNTPLVEAFLGAIRRQGGQPALMDKTGTSDLNVLAPQWHQPALVYGSGDSKLDHTPHEHISLAEFRKSVAVLTTVLQRLVGNAGR
jgi:[amino group carrier protein]-lysine/ornithine hydrolase